AEPTHVVNGESVFRLEPESELGLERVRCCEPRLLVFLERSEGTGFRLTPMSSSEAVVRLEGELMAEPPDAAEMPGEVIEKLAELSCCLLQYGGQPQDVANALAQYFDGLR